MYIHIYTYIYIYTYIHIYVHIYIYVHISVHARVCMHMYVFTCIHAFICISMYTYTCIHIYTRTRICIFIYTLYLTLIPFIFHLLSHIPIVVNYRHAYPFCWNLHTHQHVLTWVVCFCTHSLALFYFGVHSPTVLSCKSPDWQKYSAGEVCAVCVGGRRWLACMRACVCACGVCGR